MRSQPTTLILNDAAKNAIKAFRDSKPWRGTEDEKLAKFTELHRALCVAYDLETMLLRDSTRPNAFSGRSGYSARVNKILLTSRLSVVT